MGVVRSPLPSTGMILQVDHPPFSTCNPTIQQPLPGFQQKQTSGIFLAFFAGKKNPLIITPWTLGNPGVNLGPLDARVRGSVSELAPEIFK